MHDREEILRRLTLGDDAFLQVLITERRDGAGRDRLDVLQGALLRLGALAALDAPDLSFQHVIGYALDAGVSPDSIVDALVVLGPVIGSTRVHAIAPKVALAIGYDVDAALEAH